MDTKRIYQELTAGHDEVPENWISLSNLRPIQQQDDFLLWAKFWAEKLYGFEPDPLEHTMISFLSKMGTAFEARVVKELFPEAVQILANDHDCRSAEALKKSLEALHSNAQVLTKVALWSGPDVKLYGTADIVARAGLLRATFEGLSLDDPDDTWIVCDCKFSARLLDSDHRAQYEINATQVCAYSTMLHQMMGGGDGASAALLITKDTPYAPVVVPVRHAADGSIDSQVAALRDKAIDIKINGWKYRPWLGEVAINYSNSQSEPWGSLKSRIKEMTQPLEILPGIGKVKAEALRAAGHVDMKSMLASDIDRLDLRTIHGIGAITEAKIKAALRANKTGEASPIAASIVPPGRDRCAYLDFEFFPGIHAPIDNPDVPFPDCTEGVPMIFLAGVGTEDENGAFRYCQFQAEREDHLSEKRLLLSLQQHLDESGVFNPNQTSAVYHFGGAEKDRIREAVIRHGSDLERLNALPFVDLQAVFSKNNIFLPECYDSGLKSISKAISKISPDHAVSYPEGLSDAASAMCLGWAYYENPDSAEGRRIMDTCLTPYLRADCEGMFQALRWLRANADPNAEPSQPTTRPTKRPTPKHSGKSKRSTPKKHRARSRSRRRGAGWYSQIMRTSNTYKDATTPFFLSALAEVSEAQTGQKVREIKRVTVCEFPDGDDEQSEIEMWAYVVDGDPQLIAEALRRRGQLSQVVSEDTCTVCPMLRSERKPQSRFANAIGWYAQGGGDETVPAPPIDGWYMAGIRALDLR